ncbi:hypothetical protein ACIHEI_36610 [Kitasatospora sp. NPDC051984]|uniref:hypothetical protein n=1 Tax=Kitasatospora sp. NPDC051984 TaxID=3364059 RepID=UPI0037C9CCA4
MSRTRTRRTYGRAPLLLSTISPSDLSILSGLQLAMVCRVCGTWRRIVGDSDLRVIGHERDGIDGSGERCPGGTRQVVLDVTVAQWQAGLRRERAEALSAETRRSARQHYKPLPAEARAVVHLAQGRPAAAEPTSADLAARRRAWRETERAVREADRLRAEPLAGALAPIRSCHVPTEPPARAA